MVNLFLTLNINHLNLYEMKRIITYSIFSSLLLLLFVRCDNEEVKLYDSFLNVDIDSLTFAFNADSVKLPVATNMTDWNATVTGDASWLTIKSVSDMPRNFALIYPEENTTDEPRYATISITGGDFAYTVILKQDKFVPPLPPGHKILTNQNAGQLNNLLLFNEKETITNLKLSGNINYSDMLVLREMVSDMELRHINLESAVIVESENNVANSIPDNTFKQLSNLYTFVFPNTLESIGADGFSDCYGLTSIQLPNSLKKLGRAVFYNCNNVYELILSSSLVEVGHYPFAMMKIQSLDIPASLVTFNNFYFGLSLLEEVNVHEDNPEFASVDGVVTNKGFDKLVYFPPAKTEWDAPATINEIGTNGFNGLRKLTKLVMPGVTKINYRSFYNCPALETVVFDNLEELSDYSWDGTGNNGLKLLDLSKATKLRFVSSTEGGQIKRIPIYMTPQLKQNLVIKVASQSIKNQLNSSEFPNVVVGE